MFFTHLFFVKWYWPTLSTLKIVWLCLSEDWFSVLIIQIIQLFYIPSNYNVHYSNKLVFQHYKDALCKVFWLTVEHFPKTVEYLFNDHLTQYYYIKGVTFYLDWQTMILKMLFSDYVFASKMDNLRKLIKTDINRDWR